MEIKITKNLMLRLPDGFKRIKLPKFKVWVSALESGKFPKTTGELCNRKGYCCLGVLSKLQGRLQKDFVGDFIDGKGGSNITLSEDNPVVSVLDSGGNFPTGVVVFDKKKVKEYPALTDLNDTARTTFKTIAKVIKHIWKS